MSGSASVETDYRYRGYSVSDDQPVATVGAAFDHRSGAFASIVAFGAIEQRDPVIAGA